MSFSFKPCNHCHKHLRYECYDSNCDAPAHAETGFCPDCGGSFLFWYENMSDEDRAALEEE